jgi:mRNA-degrading endonuclease RelE of RelBE toxin-antitoxin system
VAIKAKGYKVIFSPAAQKEIAALDVDKAIQILRNIKAYLEVSPYPFGKTRIKKLTGFSPPLYRLRSGDFRAYYRILSDKIVILAVTDKKDSEKILRKLS